MTINAPIPTLTVVPSSFNVDIVFHLCIELFIKEMRNVVTDSHITESYSICMLSINTNHKQNNHYY